jgi:CheY-like chemotaxis protein/signal transduction histidine kinase
MTTRAAILVIDDEPGIREMLSYELSQEGFDVETADSGLAAVQAVKRRKFDLALTDLKMPGMDGVATVEALRSLDPDIEVIVATGYATVETAVLCMKNGAYDYIQKPYDLTDLTLLLDRAMQKSHLQGVVALYEASRALLGTLKHSDLVQLVVALAQRVLRGDDAALILQSRAGVPADIHRLHGSVGPPDELLLELAERVSIERRPLRFPSTRPGEILPGGGGSAAYPVALAYPLVAKEESLGALVVLRKDSSPAFSRSELQKGTVFANQLALSLDNARLYEKVETKVAELVSTREHLVRAEKLALAGQLAGAVAHEVNNPLSFVRANLDAIRDYSSMVGGLWLAAKSAAVYLRGQRSPASQDQVTRLYSAAGDEERTERMVQDIAEVVDETLEGVRRIADLVAGFTRLATCEDDRPPECVDVAQVLKECLASLPGAVDHRLRLLPTHGPMVTWLAREDLRTALLNVLAYLVAPERERLADRPATISLERVYGRARISITDPILHLSEEERQRLFDPRIEVDTRYGRTMRLNIALTLSGQLLHRNGAEISIIGRRDEGTVFQILLPEAQPGSSS